MSQATLVCAQPHLKRSAENISICSGQILSGVNQNESIENPPVIGQWKGPDDFLGGITISSWDDCEAVNWTGDFGVDGESYFGISFGSSSGIHFGWVNIYYDSVDRKSVRIRGWAYESTPDIAISAGVIPEPSTVGLLSCSAVYPLINRNRKKYGRTSAWILR